MLNSCFLNPFLKSLTLRTFFYDISSYLSLLTRKKKPKIKLAFTGATMVIAARKRKIVLGINILSGVVLC